LNAWERDGVTEADIRDALQWRVDQGRPPVKTISQLAGGVSTSHSKRVQGESARSNGKGSKKESIFDRERRRIAAEEAERGN